eukprot:3928625-Amphidinium_carterae.1
MRRTSRAFELCGVASLLESARLYLGGLRCSREEPFDPLLRASSEAGRGLPKCTSKKQSEVDRKILIARCHEVERKDKIKEVVEVSSRKCGARIE